MDIKRCAVNTCTKTNEARQTMHAGARLFKKHNAIARDHTCEHEMLLKKTLTFGGEMLICGPLGLKVRAHGPR